MRVRKETIKKGCGVELVYHSHSRWLFDQYKAQILKLSPLLLSFFPLSSPLPPPSNLDFYFSHLSLSPSLPLALILLKGSEPLVFIVATYSDLVSYFRSPVQTFACTSSLPPHLHRSGFFSLFTGPASWQFPVSPHLTCGWVCVLSRVSFHLPARSKNPIFHPHLPVLSHLFSSIPTSLSEALVSLWIFIYHYTFTCSQSWWIRTFGEWEFRGILIFWLSGTSLKPLLFYCRGKWWNRSLEPEGSLGNTWMNPPKGKEREAVCS